MEIQFEQGVKTVSRSVANEIKKTNSRVRMDNPIQTKLTIGQPNDKYEQEADSVADQVMRMPDPVSNIQRQCEGCEEEEEIQTKPIATSISPWIQTQITEEEEEEMAQPKFIQKQVEEEEMLQPKIQLQPEEEEEEPIQTKRNHESKNTKSSSWLQSSINSTRGAGAPLPNDSRSFMENRFGHDFSSVKIHNDPISSQMSRSIQAQAFTVGNDIYFNAGKFNPESSGGKHLLAHELTHTVQQRGRIEKKIQKQNGEDSEASTSATGTSATIPTSITCTPTPLSRADFLSRNGNDVSELGHTIFTLRRTLLSPDTLQYQQVRRRRFRLLPIQINLPTIDSIYTRAGRFREGSHRFAGSADCIADDYPIEWRIAASGASKIRDGEQEHCDDFNLAYQLSVLPLVQNVNRLASTGRVFRSEILAKRVITRLIGFDPDNWFDKFRCLLEQSLIRDRIASRRQIRGWHTPIVRFSAPHRHNRCRAITVNVFGSSFGQIGTHPSSSIIDLSQC